MRFFNLLTSELANQVSILEQLTLISGRLDTMAKTMVDLDNAIAALPAEITTAVVAALEPALEAGIEPIIKGLIASGVDTTTEVTALQALPGLVASSLSASLPSTLEAAVSTFFAPPASTAPPTATTQAPAASQT